MPIKRKIFHFIFNVCSLGSIGLVNFTVQAYLKTQYASKIGVLVASSLECLFLLCSWFTCVAVPSTTGKMERSLNLDNCSMKFVVYSYFIYYLCYLYCLGLWIFMYMELRGIMQEYLLWDVGLLIRLVPFALILVERLVKCVKNCGVNVGMSGNPLFGQKSSYEELT
jgi:hypothetical protein